MGTWGLTKAELDRLDACGRMFGHVLRMLLDAPALQAIDYLGTISPTQESPHSPR